MNFLHAMGAKVIGCSEQSGSIQGLEKPILENAKPCFSEEEWQRVAEGYNTLGRLAAERGMQVCLHHHMGIGRRPEIDKFMSLDDKRLPALRHRPRLVFRRRRRADAGDPQKAYAMHLKDVRPPVIDRCVAKARSSTA
jgi:inosose dehydratase